MASPVTTGEGYVGTKFRTVFVRREPPTADTAELIHWCRRFAEFGLVGPAMGNLSARTPTGFLITPTNTDPRTITAAQFVEVLAVANEEVHVAGNREPSSESMLHHAIYRARPEVNAIFHGHHDRLLALAGKLGMPVTAREQPYGTPELVHEVLLVASRQDFFLMRGHGFVALGRTCTEAGQRVEEALRRV
jgi:L-fuculose-phosphate aldolase